MSRFAVTALLVASGALAACNGWPRAPELEVARDQPEKYATYAATPGAATTLEFEHRHWLISPAPIHLTAARLRAVGSVATTVLYAEQGARAPYNVLFAPGKGDTWRRVVPID